MTSELSTVSTAKGTERYSPLIVSPAVKRAMRASVEVLSE